MKVTLRLTETKKVGAVEVTRTIEASGVTLKHAQKAPDAQKPWMARSWIEAIGDR